MRREDEMVEAFCPLLGRAKSFEPMVSGSHPALRLV
jgi:hypothetical protein